MGRLGKKTKKAGGNEPSKGGSKDVSGVQNEAAWKSIGEKAQTGGAFTEQDIEFMKKAIQVLCQSTNPLGKSIDFVTDDIESMNKEYDHWTKESKSCQVQLIEQQKITEEVVKPLQDELAEIEEKIREQTSMWKS
jgi:TRAF3-interacting protein 1